MKLLTPKEHEVVAKKSGKVVEIESIVNSLLTEEIVVNRRLNDALAKEQSELKRIGEDLELARNKGAAIVKRSILLREIKELERQMAELLKPIDDKKREADELRDEAEKILAAAKERDEFLKTAISDHNSKTEILLRRERDIVEKETDLNQREATIKSAEEEIQRSMGELGDKWAEFHKISAEREVEMRKREEVVESRKSANEAVLKENWAEKERLNDEDRAIRDKYHALGQAIKQAESRGIKLYGKRPKG